MTTQKPTFLLVHGAWHPPSCYQTLITTLSSSFPVKTITHLSLNPSDPQTATCSADTNTLRSTLLSLLSAGKEVILLTHSYGGIPGHAAAHGLSRQIYARAGKPGGVIGVINMAAFIIPEGQSLLAGEENAAWIKEDDPSPGICTVPFPIPVFYQDAPPETALAVSSSLLPHSILSFNSPSPAPAWKDPEFVGRLAYIRCMQDRAIPASMQDLMIKDSGVEWVVRDIDAGHSPFLSRPEELSDILKELAEIFGRKDV
ncbi:hypothetical protein HYFRA_00010196 [Hymenoscyphus fraxineus]|uniref:AB hydrolase-1 domain-containing protein n=1 Tax=Hymenoscyphus fraxineus TaxID=746836 RepID=A0A9N9KWU6_9HELO|nr:hypothetical protein HYFRA_00010196 [Hymenoscyphus fraxineus]